MTSTANESKNMSCMDDLRVEMEIEQLRKFKEFQPWREETEAIRGEQILYQDLLRRQACATIGKNCFIARSAAILTDKLEMGDNSWIAGGVVIRGNIRIGSNSSVNPYTHIAGTVAIGSGVRIAGLVSIYGFNHGFSRIDIEIYKQAHTSKGIIIGDGSWIGANAMITDGTQIGKHCIVAAGSVVTQSFPDYQIVGGNPAKILRDRLKSAENS